MKIAFNTPRRKWLVALIAGGFAIVYLGFSAAQLVASWCADRVELTSLQRAAWLDPGNANYRYTLGRYYDLVSRDPVNAIAQYNKALQLNPHSARYWFDLASVYQVLGNTAEQSVALERAIEADPMTPDVAWEAANFYLVQGENDKALREFRVVIANDSSNSDAALSFCWRIRPDVDALLRDVVPVSADAYVKFLTLLESHQETAATFKVWDALARSNQRFDVRQAHDYVRYLIQHKEVDEAALVWRDTAAHFGLSSYLPSSSNLVVNGNFAYDVLNAGFDWQYQKQQGVALTLDPGESHASRRSLLITFDGPGITDAGIYQYIAVQPSTRYEFTAYYKNGEMEGAGGPHFTVQDMYSQNVYYESDELKDAGFWKSVIGEFTTGPDCKLVVLRIRRLPAGSPIRGKLWVDSFHLAIRAS